MPAGLLPHAAGQQQLPGGHQAHHLTRGEGLHPEPRHRQLLSQGLDNYKLCKNNHRTRGLLLGLTVTVRVIFLVSRNTKLYGSGSCFAEFRSFHETEEKKENTKKVYRVVLRNEKKTFRFVVSHISI